MYEAPGSGVTAVLIDADVVNKKRSAVLFVGSDMVQVSKILICRVCLPLDN